jgi:uncharacterized protein (TIGR03437 family)
MICWARQSSRSIRGRRSRKTTTKSETVEIFGAGLCQVKVTIPANVASGDIPLVSTAAGLRTPSTVMITVQ